MTTMHDRLRSARIKAGFDSAAAAARAFGWPISTYAGHENGQRGFTPAVAERYADAFKVSVEWLTYGSGTPRRQSGPPASLPNGFAEPAAIPLTAPESLSLRAFRSRISKDPAPDATPYRIASDHPHLGLFADDIALVDLKGTARQGDLVLAACVDPITASSTTLLGRLVNGHIVGSPRDPLRALDGNTNLVGKVVGTIRIFSTR